MLLILKSFFKIKIDESPQNFNQNAGFLQSPTKFLENYVDLQPLQLLFEFSQREHQMMRIGTPKGCTNSELQSITLKGTPPSDQKKGLNLSKLE